MHNIDCNVYNLYAQPKQGVLKPQLVKKIQAENEHIALRKGKQSLIGDARYYRHTAFVTLDRTELSATGSD